MTEEFQKAVVEVQNAAEAAVKKGRFLVAAYYIDMDENSQPIIRMTRVTHDFPKSDLEETVRMLERDVRNEVGVGAQTQPMETAAPQAPTINLFGGGPPPEPPQQQPQPAQGVVDTPEPPQEVRATQSIDIVPPSVDDTPQ